MPTSLIENERRVREHFGLAKNTDLTGGGRRAPELNREVETHLERFNMEWHIVPAGDVVPFDVSYVDCFYPTAPGCGGAAGRSLSPLFEKIRKGHARQQGQFICVESTQKPKYLPENRQFYGTRYGFETTRDPFARYLGRASFVNGTRYAHNYPSLREFVKVVSDDWTAKGLLPMGYKLRICPPAVFNLVGTIFHPEWSETESLELGFYRDEVGNATCYSVGCNGPSDFSFLHHIEGDSDWTLLGFRMALIPE
jgi:hypothetical protein